MLRVTVCALLLHTTLGAVGHDDTAKRRSEEILRAVAAAATADYEGLQQMKAQKVATKDQIANTMATQECVNDLQKVLEKEQIELDESAEDAVKAQNDHKLAYEAKEEELKRALHNALQDIYMSIHKRYEQIQDHTTAMLTALGNEISQRAANQALWEGHATTQTEGLDADTTGNASNPLAAHGGDLLSLIEERVTKQNGDFAEAEILDELKMLLLSDAQEVAFNATMEAHEGSAYPGFNKAKSQFVKDQLILLTTLIGDKTTDVVEDEKHWSGHGSEGLGFPKGWDSTYKSLKRSSISPKYSKFEQEKIKSIQDHYVELIKAKQGKKAATIKEGAYTAAKHKAVSKFAIVQESVGEITKYLTALEELDADELKKIADIKEEFESLAADWWQLAIYHCCDIVQGNAAECGDAIDHLKKPLDSVFPGALKKPDVSKNCGRRLL